MMIKPLVRVLIAGGGIAGLTLANLLKQAGRNVRFEVTLIEAYSLSNINDTSIGGGIGLWPPSQLVLNQLPHYKNFIEGHGFLMPIPSYRSGNGKILAQAKPHFEDRFPVLSIDRNQLVKFLIDGISETSNMKLIDNKKIKHYQRDEKEIILFTEDGSAYRGDVVIACDGIHSCMRTQLMSELSQLPLHPMQLGYTYFRANVKLPIDDDTQWWSVAFETWGHGQGHGFRFGYVPLKPPYAFWFIAIKADNTHPFLQPTDKVQLVDENVKQFLKLLIKDWQPVKNDQKAIAVDYVKLIEYTEQILRTDIAKVANVTSFPWTSKDNKIVLVGDAAHATAPNIAQGAGISIEDTAELVSRLDSINYLVALTGFEKSRKHRAKVVQGYADLIAKIGQINTPCLQSIRDNFMRTVTCLFPSLQQSIFEKAVSHSLGGDNRRPYWQAPIIGTQQPIKHELFSSVTDNSNQLLSSVSRFKQSVWGGEGQGVVSVEIGKGFLSVLAKLMRMPKNMQQQPFYAKVVNLSSHRQQWTRSFGYKTNQQISYSTSHDRFCDGNRKTYLSEGFGKLLDNVFRFIYTINFEGEKELSFSSRGITLFDKWKLPLPSACLPSSKWIEKATPTGWYFEGTISLPLLGQLMSYKGEFTPSQNVEKNGAKRLIIAGGTGMIGRAVCEVFLRQGYQIFCLTRNSQQQMKLFTVQPIDLYSDWSHLIDENTIIINLAGSNPGAKRWHANVKNDIAQSRFKVIDIIHSNIKRSKQKPRKYLQASAVGFYGHSDETIFTEESMPVRSEHSGTQFRIDTCVSIEEKSNLDECDVIHLRIGHVLSNEGGILPYLRLAKFFGCKQIGEGNQFVPFIHIDDVTKAIAFIAENKAFREGPVNLTAPNGCSNKMLLNQLTCFRWLPKWSLSKKVMSLLVGESSVVLTDSEHVQPKKLQNAEFKFDFENIEQAINGLK